MERPNVPKFGNWDKGDEVPYTVYFDKARKGRGGKKMINPNDPEENPDLFPDNLSDQSGSRKASIDETPSHQRRGSNSSTRPTRLSAGSDRSIDRSPLHPQQNRGKAAGAVTAGASPAREMKSPLHSNHGNRTPGRTRMKPTGTPDRSGTAIPPFGQWDDNDPDSAENYTHIFDNASKERQCGSSNAPPANSVPSNYKNPKHEANDQTCCCFGWFRK